ncbi:MAG: hypothetical protein HZA54_16570 [Planctomycetes bacterium]|nr:hypothetical protein [Planctomycetota bacterium]
MVSLKGRAWWPGLPGTGLVVAAELDDAGLRLATTPPVAVALEALAVEPSGFDRSELRLEWETEGGRAALVVTERGTLVELLRAAPAALAPRLERWQARTLARGRTLRLVVAIALGLALTACVSLTYLILGWL